MDDLLLGYALNAVDAAERRAVEAQLRDDPIARRRLDLLRGALAPLAADRPDAAPPADLVARTVARAAVYFPPPRPLRVKLPAALAGNEPVYAGLRWRRADVLIAASILILIGGLGVSGLAHVQRRHALAVCQNNLRQSFESLATYAGQRDNLFPRISDQPPRNVAAAYVPILAEAGCLPDGVAPACPLRAAGRPDRFSPAEPAWVDTGYAYSLGYRDRGGQLHGLSLDSVGADHDYLPIMADLPSAVSHQSGQNVLFIGGHVRYCTTTRVGVNGDEIYKNQIYRLAAGLHRLDTSLASGDTCP